MGKKRFRPWVSIGSDLEFLMVSDYNDDIIPAHYVISGGIKDSLGVDGNNEIGEIRPCPSFDIGVHLHSMRRNINKLLAVIDENEEYGNDIIVEVQSSLAPIGSHIHFGVNDVGRKMMPLILDMLDLFLLYPQTWFIDMNAYKERTKCKSQGEYYGRPGDFRLKEHGFEYRPLGSWWLESYEFAELVLGVAQFIVHSMSVSGLVEGDDLDYFMRNRNEILDRYMTVDYHSKFNLYKLMYLFTKFINIVQKKDSNIITYFSRYINGYISIMKKFYEQKFGFFEVMNFDGWVYPGGHYKPYCSDNNITYYIADYKMTEIAYKFDVLIDEREDLKFHLYGLSTDREMDYAISYVPVDGGDNAIKFDGIEGKTNGCVHKEMFEKRDLIDVRGRFCVGISRAIRDEYSPLDIFLSVMGIIDGNINNRTFSRRYDLCVE